MQVKSGPVPYIRTKKALVTTRSGLNRLLKLVQLKGHVRSREP